MGSEMCIRDSCFTTTTTHSTMERRVRTVDSHLLRYVIAVPRYCCSTWWVGGSLGGCVHVFVGGCVGGCVGSYVVDCVLSILNCAVDDGDHLSDDLLFLCVFFVRLRSGIVRYLLLYCCITVVLLLLLYYYRTHIVGSWGIGGCFLSAVCCAVLLLYQVLRTAVVGTTCCCSTCLLYTSPSPRDLSTSRMPSSA